MSACVIKRRLGLTIIIIKEDNMTKQVSEEISWFEHPFHALPSLIVLIASLFWVNRPNRLPKT